MPFRSTTDPGVAAAALAEGNLAVIPTETVYGLGALASEPRAVARVFAVKGRPADHPLIAHVADAAAAAAWVASVPDYARELMATYWPGPLTLVLPRSRKAADYITGGQDTVAVRVPGSPVTRAVIREVCAISGDSSAAVAAPSANRFGHVSPTTAQHVVEDLGALLEDADVILDAGPCAVGVESTIVDCTRPHPAIMRPGKVSAREVAATTGLELGVTSQIRVPGTLASHYSPHAQVHLIDAEMLPEIPASPEVGVIASMSIHTPPGAVRLSTPGDDTEYAASLYRALREADSLKLTDVYAVPPTGPGLAEAIRDRLQRAAAS